MRALLLLSSLLLALSGCGGSSFKDSLTFGTGISGTGFTLTGETDTFSVATLGSTGQIWFKLESANAFGKRAGRLYINYSDGKTPYWQRDYSGLQADGHMLLSSFRVTDSGSYVVKAYLVEQVGPDIGKETFVADHALTMTK